MNSQLHASHKNKRYLNRKPGMPILHKNIGVLCLCLLPVLAACGKSAEPPKKGPSSTLVSTTAAQSIKLEVREETVGTLEGFIDPTIAAEVAARVVQISATPGKSVRKGDLLAVLDVTDYTLQRREAQAEVSRIQALLDNQKRLVERNQTLVEKNFISKTALDEVTTQESALREQLDGARAKLASISHTGNKARIVAPIDGVVEKQIVSVGGYVKVGDPILQIISRQRLRAHLPFPEGVAAKIRPGLPVRLTTPTAAGEVTTQVRELKPMVGANNRAVDITADVVDQPGWQPGASVNAVIVLDERPAAIVVPEQSVVLRPAGDVVYVIKDELASQRKVITGMRQGGFVEILDGLAAGEVVAVDGAAFLTDQAKVSIQKEGAQKQSVIAMDPAHA
jgi:membrane fusion protein (multidrug efflux system)